MSENSTNKGGSGISQEFVSLPIDDIRADRELRRADALLRMAAGQDIVAGVAGLAIEELRESLPPFLRPMVEDIEPLVGRFDEDAVYAFVEAVDAGRHEDAFAQLDAEATLAELVESKKRLNDALARIQSERALVRATARQIFHRAALLAVTFALSA